MNAQAQLPGEWDVLTCRITGEQEAVLSLVRDEWLRIGQAVGPADRDAAEAGVRRAYKVAGLPPPARVVWLGSPLHGAVAAAALTGLDLSSNTAPWARARHELESQGQAANAGAAGRPVRGWLGPLTWWRTRMEVEAQVGRALWRQVWSRTGRQLWERLEERLLQPVRGHVGAELDPGIGWHGTRRLLSLALGGQDDVAWYATADGLRRALPGVHGPGHLAGLMQVAANAGWWWPFERAAILTERPSALSRDDQGRLHRADGPALAWPDGTAVHLWHGERLPHEVIDQLAHPSVQRIQAAADERLAELMLEAYGAARYLRDAGAVRVHQDGTGTLWYAPLRGSARLAMVEVVNTTPEPDGTHRTYWLRVPPWTERAREAVAWTFQVPPSDYRPVVES
jgi:hypothetical protein